jgi:hypothetical protein
MSIFNYLKFYNFIYDSTSVTQEENFTVVKPESKKYLIIAFNIC